MQRPAASPVDRPDISDDTTCPWTLYFSVCFSSIAFVPAACQKRLSCVLGWLFYGLPLLRQTFPTSTRHVSVKRPEFRPLFSTAVACLIVRSVADNICAAMSFLAWAVKHTAPIFLVTSPVTSYADQIWNTHKTRSSAGFSLDIPLIMLVASILKVFYWFGSHYDKPLLVQAIIMIGVQILLLHVSLLYRPAQYALSQPFAGAREGDALVARPFNFWQWRAPEPYWEFLAYYSAALAVLQLLVGTTDSYIALQGFVALSVEALLPIPQIMENHRSRSSKGFRLSVLANWLIGDAFKMAYFFLSEGDVPLAFKLCGLFQAACDCYLGVQYWMYGEGADDITEEFRLA